MDNIGNTKHALTFAALRVHYYTGRSYLISGEGRNKVFGYRHGVMTDIGDLPEAEWTRLAKQLIRQSGEQELYQQLFAWEREQSHWEQSPSQFELDVLSLHMARLPDNPAWCDFMHNNIYTWYADAQEAKLWRPLLRKIQFETKENLTMETTMNNPFAGKTVVATGKLEHYTRDGIQEKLISLGAHPSGAVSKKTDYLIVGEKAGSKLTKAQQLGVKTLTEQEFEDMLA